MPAAVARRTCGRGQPPHWRDRSDGGGGSGRLWMIPARPARSSRLQELAVSLAGSSASSWQAFMRYSWMLVACSLAAIVRFVLARCGCRPGAPRRGHAERGVVWQWRLGPARRAGSSPSRRGCGPARPGGRRNRSARAWRRPRRSARGLGGEVRVLVEVHESCRVHAPVLASDDAVPSGPATWQGPPVCRGRAPRQGRKHARIIEAWRGVASGAAGHRPCWAQAADSRW